MIRFSSRASRVAIISSSVASSSVSLSTKSAWAAIREANGSSSGTSPIAERLGAVGLKGCASGREPRGCPRKRDGVADVLELANPLNQPLHPHPEARVLHAAEATGVEVPIVRLRVLSLFSERLLDPVEVRLAFAPSDDLADPVAGDHIEREDEIRMLRVPRLVEGLRDPRVVRHDDRRSEEHTSELQSRQYLVCRLLL